MELFKMNMNLNMMKMIFGIMIPHINQIMIKIHLNNIVVQYLIINIFLNM